MRRLSECTCPCHTTPGMKHMAPCCYPDAEVAREEAYYEQVERDIADVEEKRTA